MSLISIKVSTEIENSSNFLMHQQILTSEIILGRNGVCSFYILYYFPREGVGLGLQDLDTH